jgi:acyl-CoA thioester hydrolase
VRVTADPSLDPAAYAFVHRLRARFAETDAMGIVHHAAYLPWLEAARVEYLRALGHPYAELRSSGTDLAVVEVSVRYLRPVHFDDLVDVHLVPAAAARATFQLAYLLSVEGAPRATAVTVHGALGPGGRPTRLPAWLRDHESADRR